VTFGAHYIATVQKKRLVIHILAFVALLIYGLIVDPETGKGGIPCLWKALFGLNCPGCGLSRAGALLLHGRLAEAAKMNWIIFPVVAVLTWKFLIEVGGFTQEFRFFRLSERSLRWQKLAQQNSHS
jgi:hypothetical protein